MTDLESQILERAAVPFLKWTASKLKAGLLGKSDRRLVSGAVRELLSASPNLARVEDLLARINGQPDGLAYVRHHLKAAKEARRAVAPGPSRVPKKAKKRRKEKGALKAR